MMTGAAGDKKHRSAQALITTRDIQSTAEQTGNQVPETARTNRLQVPVMLQVCGLPAETCCSGFAP